MEGKTSTETYFSRQSNHLEVNEEDEYNWVENQDSEMSAFTYSSTAPITEMHVRKDATSTIPRFQWERKFPNISYLLNQKNDWDALLKVLKLTEETINKKGLYNKDQNKKEIQTMQQIYKDWWTLIRSTQSLHEGNVRKLSKLLRTFIITAMEEPTHNVRIQHVTAAAKEKIKQMTLPSLRSYTKSIQKSSFRPQRSLVLQNKANITPEKTKDLGFETIKLESRTKSSREISSKSARLSKVYPPIISRHQMTETNSVIMGSKKISALGPESSTSLPSYIMPGIADILSPSSEDGSKDNLTAQVTDTLNAQATNQEERYCMQIILKDILKDIAKHAEGQEGMLGKSPKRFPKSSGYGQSFRKRFPTQKYSSYPPAPLPCEIPSAVTSLVRKTKTGMSDGQTALNEINRLLKGQWPTMTYGEAVRRYPTLLQDLRNVHVKKSLLVPQERAKRVLNSNLPSVNKICVRELGSKRFGKPL